MSAERPVACIVLPTYDEADNVALLLPAIFAQQAWLGTHELHVLVVDDESPDGTQDVVRRLAASEPRLHLITGARRGLGEAYKRGLRHAIDRLEPELVLQMDADLQHDPALIPLFVTLAGHGFDVVIGSRFAPGGSTPDFSPYRRFLSHAGNWLIRVVGGMPRIADCTSGYRCLRASLVERCDLRFMSTRGYSFQSSLLCELVRQGARLIEVPIVFADRKRGASKLALRDQLEFLLNLPRLRRNRGRAVAPGEPSRRPS